LNHHLPYLVACRGDVPIVCRDGEKIMQKPYNSLVLLPKLTLNIQLDFMQIHAVKASLSEF
jgi:hypothetical protein